LVRPAATVRTITPPDFGFPASMTWRMSTLLGNYVTPVPAQMRRGPHWFAGSADALYQNFNLLYDERPDHVIVFGADHIYRMDPRQMVEQHVANGAGVTVAAIPVPLEQSRAFGFSRLTRLERCDRTAWRFLRDVAEPRAPRQVDRALVGLDLPDERFHQRRLTCAVATDEPDPSARRDSSGRALQDRAAAQPHGKIIDGDHCGVAPSWETSSSQAIHDWDWAVSKLSSLGQNSSGADGHCAAASGKSGSAST